MFDFANNGKFVIVDSLLLCYDQVSLPFDHLKCCQTTFQLYIIPKKSIKKKKIKHKKVLWKPNEGNRNHKYMWPNLIVEKFLSKCNLFDQSNVKSNHSIITSLGMNIFTNSFDWKYAIVVWNLSNLKVIYPLSRYCKIKYFCNLCLPSNFIKKFPLKIYHFQMK